MCCRLLYVLRLNVSCYCYYEEFAFSALLLVPVMVRFFKQLSYHFRRLVTIHKGHGTVG